jgi:hypothetical protein
MMLTSNAREALRLAAERDDGKLYQGWITKAEFVTLATEGYVRQDFVHTPAEQGAMAERFRTHVRTATDALHRGGPDDWRLALEHLRSASNLEEERSRRWWVLTERGRHALLHD